MPTSITYFVFAFLAAVFSIQAPAETILPTSDYACQNCKSWCQTAYLQNGNRRAYESCAAGCAEVNLNCSISAPEFHSFILPDGESIAPMQSMASAALTASVTSANNSLDAVTSEITALKIKEGQQTVELARAEADATEMKFNIVIARYSKDQIATNKAWDEFLKAEDHRKEVIRELDKTRQSLASLGAWTPAH